MGKPTRRPLLGYNHNVRYGGRILHVQTEDSGPANPLLHTHLFFEGSILATKRHQYDAAFPEDGVRGLMQGQHKEILKELKQGLYDNRLGDFFAARGEIFTPPPVTEASQGLLATETEAPPPHTDAPHEPPALPSDATPIPGPEILDLDSIPTPPPERMPTPEPLPMPIIRPHVSRPETYTFRRPVRDIATPGPGETRAPRGGARFPTSQPPGGPASPVVVQRRIVVGAGATNPGAARPMVPRPRRPGGGVPYVVQEGRHPNLLASRQPEHGVPPATPMGETADSSAAPRTAAPPSVPREPPPESLVSTRSLDDVILAYLSKGDHRR